MDRIPILAKNQQFHLFMRILNGLLIITLVILQYRMWLGEGGLRHNLDLQEKIENQKIVNEQLEARNSHLAAEVLSLQEGTAGIEEYARSQLGMIKPEETFYLIVDKNRQ